METLLQFLGLNDNFFSQCDIYIDENNMPNGSGLLINKYVLTLDHIITGKNIYINKIKYDVLYKIEEYDIIVLQQFNYNGNINEFLNELNNYIRYINISEIDNHINTQFKIFKSNLILNLNKIENTFLKSNILPEILLGKFNIIFNKFITTTTDLSGLSGSVCYKDKHIFGLLVSQNNSDIEVIPVEIIYDLLNIHHKHKIRYIPININGNIITSNYKNLYKNDMIIQMNDINVDDFGMVYFDKYKQYISISTYILLYEHNIIYFKIQRNTHKSKKKIEIQYKIENFTENKIQINIKENEKKIIIKNLCFKELSEEYLLKIYSIKKIPSINYANIYSNKKLLYLDDNNTDENIIDKSSLLLLNKISGHKINNLNQIKHYFNQKKCVIELINSNNEIIKINI